MIAIKEISIPEPCSQSWQDMTQKVNGRHCENCCKTVVDFATMSDSDIIAYLATQSNICGRFNGDQLPRLNQLLLSNKPRKNIWKNLWIAASIACILSTVKVEAQVRKSAQIHHEARLNVQKNTSINYTRTGPVYSQALTADKINITTKIKPIDIKKFTVDIENPSAEVVIGGVQVSAIIIDEKRNTYLSVWDFLKF